MSITGIRKIEISRNDHHSKSEKHGKIWNKWSQHYINMCKSQTGHDRVSRLGIVTCWHVTTVEDAAWKLIFRNEVKLCYNYAISPVN